MPKKLSSPLGATRRAEVPLRLPSPKPKLLLDSSLPRSNGRPSKSSGRADNLFSALLNGARDNPAVTATVLASMAVGGAFLTPAPAMAATHDTHALGVDRIDVDNIILDQPSFDASTPINVDAPAPSEDENVLELKEKVGKLVDTKFNGDYAAAFSHYDKSGDGGINKSELEKLLSDAKVGNFFTRGGWVDGIMKKLDKESGNRDGKIQWLEFQKALETAPLTLA